MITIVTKSIKYIFICTWYTNLGSSNDFTFWIVHKNLCYFETTNMIILKKKIFLFIFIYIFNYNCYIKYVRMIYGANLVFEWTTSKLSVWYAYILFPYFKFFLGSNLCIGIIYKEKSSRKLIGQNNCNVWIQ